MHTTVELPLIRVPKLKSFTPFVPSDADRESAIVALLTREGRLALQAGNHSFIAEQEPPILHHPDSHKHSIYWVNPVAETADVALSNEVTSWHDQSWQELAKDTVFLQHAEQHFTQLQKKNPLLRIYHVYGFASDSAMAQAKELQGIAPRAAQSQYRAHVHITEGFSAAEQYKLTESGALEWSDLSSVLARKPVLASLFFNQPAERLLASLEKSLLPSGTKIEWEQMVGRKNQQIAVQRTFFSFATWAEALRATVQMDQMIAAHWLALASEAVRQPSVVAGLILPSIQSCVFSASVVRLSALDCHRAGFSEKEPWIVAPCSLGVPSTLLSPAHLLDR